MANRYWRVAANFHRVGDLVVTVASPNWQSALRKAALAIKRLPVMKGKRMNMGSFMLQEIEAPVQAEVATNVQLPLEVAQAETLVEEQTPPATTSEPEE